VLEYYLLCSEKYCVWVNALSACLNNNENDSHLEGVDKGVRGSYTICIFDVNNIVALCFFDWLNMLASACIGVDYFKDSHN